MATYEYDYVVVGAGAAGCALASRLAQTPGRKVALLEYGPRDSNPLLHIPKGFFFTLKGERYAYKYETLPVSSTGAAETWTRGKVLGGSSAVNGMMYLRGAKPDFDALEAATGPLWGWDKFLGAYRAIEDHSLGESELRGAGGPLGISFLRDPEQIHRDIFAAGQESHGWSIVEDMNETDDERIGLTPSTMKRGQRVSAYRAFLRRGGGSNVDVHTGTRAARLLFDGTRVSGVRAVRRGGMVDYRARSEVIVCCGSIETPLLLERSGIGRPDVLSRAGVQLKVESPNVGENVIEQRMVIMQVKLEGRVGVTERINSTPKQLLQGGRYLLTRKGPVGTPAWDITCQFKSRPELARPDVQGIFAPIALDPSSADYKLAKHSGIIFFCYPMRPTTASSIHITGPDVVDPPEIGSRFLEAAAERDSTGAIVAAARELFASGPLARYRPTEEFPAAEVRTPEDAVEWARRGGAGIYHAVGSAAMGPDESQVVDPELRVRGVEGLRVADISVLPFQVSGNTVAPAMALGWLAAELVGSSR